jgi:hypothetical protein
MRREDAETAKTDAKKKIRPSRLSWRSWRLRVAFVFCLFCAEGLARADVGEQKLDLGSSCSVEFEKAGSIKWTSGNTTAATADHPATIYILAKSGAIAAASAQYGSVVVEKGTATAKAAVTSPAGSIFDVADRYSAGNAAGPTTLSRSVTVRTAAADDVGFRSEFSVRLAGPADLKEASVFIPGIWYDDGRHTPVSGMLRDLGRPDFLFREDRLPLPVVTVRDRASGRTVTLIHLKPDGGTFAAEATPATVTDDRLKFGSIGVRNRGGVSVVFDDPGVEGDQTRLGKFAPDVRRAERFRPVRVGNAIDDQLIVRFDQKGEDDDALKVGWRAAWTACDPPVALVPLQAVLDDSISLLDHYGGDQSGTPGFPFTVNLPDGTVRDVSLQMGFVGEQIPCGAFLIEDGLKNHRPPRVKKGTAIVDFWAHHTLGPAGIPRVWYDVGNKGGHWRDYPTYTRIATDGMRGMLRAWRICQASKIDHPKWLACCRTYGDWLVAHQGADGSFVRAVDSFLSLYEATDDKKWLDAATRAADFTETWLYGWNVPMPRDDPKVSLPAGKTTVGMSLIAVGHSGADVFLAFAPFAYQRLAAYTGDAHYAAVARVLMDGTRQYVDVNGSAGYARSGLVTEATNVAAPRGHGVNVWLPWCTAAVVEPMLDFQEAFGTVDIDRIQKMPVEVQKDQLRAYVKNLGGARSPT